MADIPAILLENIQVAALTDDRKHAVVTDTSRGAPLHLAIPATELQNLLILLLQAMDPLDQEQQKDGRPTRVLPVERWFFSISRDTAHLLLSFYTPEGAEMSFAVHPSAIGRMVEVLSSLGERASTNVPQGATRQ